MMKPDEKDTVIEYLRSVALIAHEAINNLRKDNYGDVREAIDDIEITCRRLKDLISE